MLKRFLLTEYHQINKLGLQGKIYIQTVILLNLLNPIFAIFMFSFIWRQTEDIRIVALYNLAMFFGLPIGFYLNGLFMKYLSIKKLYYGGVLSKAFVLMLLVFLPTNKPLLIVFFGLLYGLSAGLFWSNRNLLTLRLTRSDNRLYFSSIDFFSNTLSSIVVPLFIGFFISYGPRTNLYNPNHAYIVIGITTIVLSGLLGLYIKKLNVGRLSVPKIALRHASPEWNMTRSLTLLMGLFMGINTFLPTVMILQFVGKEDVLGLLQSIVAVFTAIVLYTIARSINTKYRPQMIAVGIFLTILGSLYFAVSPSNMGVIMFILFSAIGQILIYSEVSTINMDLIDRENAKSPNYYAYVFDAEVSLNAGRILGIIIFFYYITVFSISTTLQIVPILFALSQIFMVVLARYIEKQKIIYQTKSKPVKAYIQ